ncbi:MAG: hypothetical protein ABEJ93_01940 [Candidatus Nanohalobium sp.]
MKNKVTAVVLVAVLFGMVATTSAVTSDESSSNTITANVTSTVAIDVKPEKLSYPGLEVGNRTTKSNRSFTGINIANTGSEYIDRVWVGHTAPNTRPFGSGDPKAYDAGNFLMIKPENKTGLDVRGDDNTFHYINRREFEDTSPPTFINKKKDTQSQPYVDQIGRIRFGDEWLFFDLLTTSDGSTTVCDGGGSPSADLRIGTTTHTPEKLGTYDFTNDGSKDGVRYKEYDITSLSNSKYGVTNSTVDLDFFRSGENQTYSILTGCQAAGFQQNHIVLTKYNVAYNDSSNLYNNAPGAAIKYILRGSTASGMLQPGESFTTDLAMQTPRGVSAGQVSDGTLTVYATADISAQQ